jgi:hypothetical protein
LVSRFARPHKNKATPEQAPLCYEGQIESGGAGIRTPVRDKIDHSFYVRVPLIEVSSRWPMDSPLLDKFPKFSPTAGKRDDRLSRIFDTLKTPQEGFNQGRCSNS